MMHRGPCLKTTVRLVVAATTFVTAGVLLYPDIANYFQFGPTGSSLSNANMAADIPPAFAGNRAAYGFALFSLFTMSTLAIRKIHMMILMLKNEPWRQNPDVGLYRLAIIFGLATILCGAVPDVALLLVWGEVSASFTVDLMTVDRIGDGLTIVPFLTMIGILVRVEQLERLPQPDLDRLKAFRPVSRTQEIFAVIPRKDAFAEQARIIGSVFIIAAGLAIFK